MWLPGRHEAVASRLEDLASAIDAGLSPRAALRAGAGEASGWTAGLRAEGVRLSGWEWASLEAGEGAGDLPSTLRRLAAGHRLRARLMADSVARLRYPAVLLATTGLVAGIVAWSFGTTGPLWALAGLAAALAAGVLLALRGLRNPGFTGRTFPPLRELLRDLGEIPYLSALQSLYGAGVKLKEAHALAVRAVPVAWVRMRLHRSTAPLDEGRQLTESLAAGGALSAETLELIAGGERIGGLEEALGRALERRQHTVERRLSALVRWVAFGITVLVFALAASVILSFYLGPYASFGRRH